MFDTVVLAGSGKPEPLTEQEGVSNKAFIMIHGKPMLSYILKALQETPSVGRVVVVGPLKELEQLCGDDCSFESVPEAGSMLDNLAEGFKAVDQNRLSLIVTGDIPLINRETIEDFLSRCAPHDQDFYYPVISRDTCLRHFPETKRTYVRLKDGHITGANIALLSPSWFMANRARLEMFISYRKKPLKLLRLLPLSFAFRYLFKVLSVSDLENHLSRLLGLKARAVFCNCVEAAVDVDKLNDLELVKKTLSARS